VTYQDLNATFRPIDRWPGDETRNRKPSPFRVGWGDTLELLKRELRHLRATNVICQLAITERELRLDGYPRTNARPSHPGVILAFNSAYGPLKYACDRFTSWDDNIRAVALGLEALRKVERYGITKRGEQYTGWRALPASTTPVTTTEAAARFIGIHSRAPLANLLTDPAGYQAAYRSATKRLHPDAGGSVEDFQRLQEAKRILDAHHGGTR
jgi:hypothetical protein